MPRTAPIRCVRSKAFRAPISTTASMRPGSATPTTSIPRSTTSATTARSISSRAWPATTTITGNGNTRAVYFNAAAAVTVDLASGTGRGTAAGDLAKVGTRHFRRRRQRRLRRQHYRRHLARQQQHGAGKHRAVRRPRWRRHHRWSRRLRSGDLFQRSECHGGHHRSHGRRSGRRPGGRTVDGDDPVGHDTLVSIEFGDRHPVRRHLQRAEFRRLQRVPGPRRRRPDHRQRRDPARLLQRHLERDGRYEAGNGRWRRLGRPRHL